MIFAKKRFSQNFLKNDKIAERIVEALDIKDSDNVIEVGPGRGVLTKFILKKTDNAYFVELDKNMCEVLDKKFKLGEKLINEDILKLDLNKIFNRQKVKIIGNFPYNISGKLIRCFYENKDIIEMIIGMFQKEVVDRIIAEPCKKNYGIMSIFTQIYYNVDSLFNVVPDEFIPKPNVMSSVCSFKRNDITKIECNENLFRQVVKLSFSSKRKMLKNNLKPFDYWKFIDEKYLKLRPEMLSINDYIAITNSISSKINDQQY